MHDPYAQTATAVETHVVPEKGYTVTTVSNVSGTDTAAFGADAGRFAEDVAYWVRETDYWCRAQHEATQHLREISERMQAAQ